MAACRRRSSIAGRPTRPLSPSVVACKDPRRPATRLRSAPWRPYRPMEREHNLDSRQNAIERPVSHRRQSGCVPGRYSISAQSASSLRCEVAPSLRSGSRNKPARQPSPNGLILTAVGATTRRPGGHLAVRAGQHFYPAARCRPGQGRNRCWPPTGELHVPLPNRRQGALSIAPANATPDCPPEHRAIGGSGRHWSQACGSQSARPQTSQFSHRWCQLAAAKPIPPAAVRGRDPVANTHPRPILWMMARHPLPQQRIAGVLNRHQRQPARSLKPAGECMDGVVPLNRGSRRSRRRNRSCHGQVQLVSQSAQRLARLGQTRNALRVAPVLPAPRLARKCYFLDWFGDAFPDQSARGEKTCTALSRIHGSEVRLV